MDEQIQPTLERSATWWRNFSAVLLACGLLYFTLLGSRAIWSEELRWVQIPREMTIKQDYFSPTINGKSYYDKPLGSYWLVILASYFTNGINETASRIPCAISGLIAVAFTMLIARRFYPAKVALASGIILGTCHSFVFFSRHASTDIETIAGVLACLWLFLKNQSMARGNWVFLFWILMALTSLTKGLLGFVLPGLICMVYSTVRQFSAMAQEQTTLGKLRSLLDANAWLFQSRTFFAFPLAILIYLTPFLVSIFLFQDSNGLGMVWRENIRRFYDPVNHKGPVYLYLGVIFILPFPWSLFLPAALYQSFTQKTSAIIGRSNHLFALCYFLSVFIFFSLASSRRSYYLLPILPSVAWLVAGFFFSNREDWNRTTRFLTNLGLSALLICAMVMFVGGTLGTSILPAPWNLHPPPVHGWILSFVGTITFLAIVISQRMPLRFSSIVPAIIFAFGSMSYLFLIYFPWAEEFRTQRSFARKTKDIVQDMPTKLAYYRTREAVYYLGYEFPVQEYYTPETLLNSVSQGKTRWLILKQRDLSQIAIPFILLAQEQVYPWEKEQSSSKLQLIELGRN